MKSIIISLKGLIVSFFESEKIVYVSTGIVIGSIIPIYIIMLSVFNLDKNDLFKLVSILVGLISSITALYLGLRKPKPNLQNDLYINYYRINQNGIEIYSADKKDIKNRFEFTNISKCTSWFKLYKVIRYNAFQLNNYSEVIYDLVKNVDMLPGTEEFTDLKTTMVLNDNNPVNTIDIKFETIASIRKHIEYYIDEKNNKIPKTENNAKLKFIFKTNVGYKTITI